MKRCRRHPRYKAVYPPRVSCDPCWAIWDEAHPDAAASRWVTLEEALALAEERDERYPATLKEEIA